MQGQPEKGYSPALRKNVCVAFAHSLYVCVGFLLSKDMQSDELGTQNGPWCTYPVWQPIQGVPWTISRLSVTLYWNSGWKIDG